MTAKAKVRIEGENATAAAWRSVMGDAQSASKKMGGYFRGAFAGISGAAIYGVAKAAIKMGDDLSNAAKAAGIGGSTMSELAYVAKQTDIELTSLSKAIKTMKVNLSEAASGGKAPIATLKAIGLEIKDLRGLKADEQFEIIGDAISRMGDETDRTRALTEIFGKAGEDVGRAFSEGAEGVRKMREEAVATGAALSDETIEQLAATDDEVKKLESTWAGFVARMVAKYGPELRTAMDFWSNAPRNLSEQIADLEDEIDDVVGTRGTSAETQKAALRKRLAELRELAKQESMREMGIGSPDEKGKPAPGFDNEALRNARDAAAKSQQEMIDNQLELNEQFNREMMEQNQERFDHEFEAEMENQQIFTDAALERAALMKEIQEKQANEVSEAALIVRDGFLNAWDDMVNTGKFKWKELLKFMVAEFARMQIVKLFDGMMKGGGGIGGIFGSLWGGLKSVFGGFRDSGGRGDPGKAYAITPKAGTEVFWPDSKGKFYPNVSGGGIVIHAPTTIDARGASMELMKTLPKLLEQNRKATIAEVVDGLRRNKFAF